MNKIYRIYKENKKESIAIGYLLNETDFDYIFRVQNGAATNEKSFKKATHKIESIYELNGESTYNLKTKNSNGENITVELSKACYGGCG